MDHRITGEWTNEWGQKTALCSCGWTNEPENFDAHLVHEARLVTRKAEREAEVEAARKVLAKK